MKNREIEMDVEMERQMDRRLVRERDRGRDGLLGYSAQDDDGGEHSL